MKRQVILSKDLIDGFREEPDLNPALPHSPLNYSTKSRGSLQPSRFPIIGTKSVTKLITGLNPKINLETIRRTLAVKQKHTSECYS